MMRRRRVGILGGTFDPIHFGHLAAGEAARRALGLDRVVLVPTHDPPHRAAQPRASAFHRFAMAALAIDDTDGLFLSDIELSSEGPSFTATTVRRLHDQGLQPSELFFITGSDAFAEIASWHDYPAILDYCHFVAISRTRWPLAALRGRIPNLAPRMHSVTAPETGIVDAADDSALSIYLVEYATPDVSSTEIRDRLRDGVPIGGLVPPTVERYIRRHAIYGGSSGTTADAK